MDKKTLKEKLIKSADKFAQRIYPLTYKFPQEEKFALGDQIRRSVISVPANIIEGFARGGEKEKRNFFNIAYASLKEAKYLVYFAHKQGVINEKDYKLAFINGEEVSKLLFTFLKILKKSS